MIMDSHNLFLTSTTCRLLRAEYGAALIAAVVVTLIHLGHIRWPVFTGMFVYIDLIGYLPGAVAYRRGPRGALLPWFFFLLNITHTLFFPRAGGAPRRPAGPARGGAAPPPR